MFRYAVVNQFSLLPNVIIKQVSGQLAPPHTDNQNSTEVTDDQQKSGTNPLPPPIMMKITKTYREQVDTVKRIFPHLRLKTTGEYIKLYSNTTEQNRIVRQTLIGLGYKFYVITPKNERPIKVVIKGYPKTADPNHIKSDLEKEGFLPERVTQLIGRRTKQKLPVFQVTLPRSMENLKIFDLKTLAHLNITVDGYNGKGITQYFSCNNFHHNAENCFLKPRCLKCGEEHLTKDYPIKQRLETKFCINCRVYGHMANWYGCPCFPKPKKGAAKINRNSYTNLYNSFVKPNFSYAQVAKNSNNSKTNFNSQNKPQMAPRKPETSNQTEASNNVPPLQNQVQNSNQAINSNPTPNLNLNNSQNELKKKRQKELKNYTNENWTARLQALNTQDNSLWAVQKFFKNKRSDIPSLHCTTGTAITDKQKADILAESILTNFTENERQNNDFDDDDEIVNNTVNAFLSHPPPPTAETAYPSEIISYIKSSNPKKAPGKDGISNRMTKNFTLKAILILTILVNKILKHNYFPKIWKEAILSFPYLSQKAFDRVWLTGLTFKLITYNIPPPLICLLHSYNSDRSYQVRVKDTISNTKNIRCGVAQGSLLGPLLFNLYINDIPDYTLTKLNMFADDTAVHTTYRRISSVTYALNKHLKLLEKYYDQ
ncbi:nucleic-acid-binding protein from transposon X-element [Trichonephila clavipes]|nr:nucleic-acid-binding protein from transposon X-element [Trichonephila clavipes]